VKECKRCGQRKPLDMFSPNKKARDGRHSYCKTCRSEYANAYHKRHRKSPGRVKAPDREEIWPRPLTEALLDLKVRNWRYPATAGQLTWRV
jgi:hypothetical protein